MISQLVESSLIALLPVNAMSALGQKQPLSIISGERLLSATTGHSVSPENDQMTVKERPVAGKRAQKPDIQGSASDAEKIPGMLAMQSGRNSV
jgi:hypothetical protein